MADQNRNEVSHAHHGFTYTYALDADGDLVQRVHDHDGFTLATWEKVLPQTEPIVNDDPESDAHGEVAEIDPKREAYIAALKVVLETTRDQSDDDYIVTMDADAPYPEGWPSREVRENMRADAAGEPIPHDLHALAEAMDHTARPVDRDSGRTIWPGEDTR